VDGLAAGTMPCPGARRAGVALQPDTLRRLKSAPVVAYIPLVDVDVFERELAKA
jgi:hypothetical protein